MIPALRISFPQSQKRPDPSGPGRFRVSAGAVF
jgi:hypothetical protein